MSDYSCNAITKKGLIAHVFIDIFQLISIIFYLLPDSMPCTDLE